MCSYFPLMAIIREHFATVLVWEILSKILTNVNGTATLAVLFALTILKMNE